MCRSCPASTYHRLNEDYQPLHALCRFFLENTGPSHNVGNRKMLPFLVNMDRLFEQFVAEWLRIHLPPEWSIESQERVYIGDDQNWYFEVDLVMYRSDTSEPVCVLDTKYKAHKSSSDDIAQVVAYAGSKSCKHAVLIYPTAAVAESGVKKNVSCHPFCHSYATGSGGRHPHNSEAAGPQGRAHENEPYQCLESRRW
jgi:5-methylcytosine-specific restriction endonuclease McrBC regulatory subunit McrC